MRTLQQKNSKGATQSRALCRALRALPRKTREEEKIIRRFTFLSFAGLVFLTDQIFKIILSRVYPEGTGFPVIPGVFHITMVHNSGAAFGILGGNTRFLILVSLGVIAGLLFFLRRPSLAWALVLGGAFGNLYDRLRFGYVIDFLDFRVWPVFNLADACICVGVGCIVWSFFKHAPHSS